ESNIVVPNILYSNFKASQQNEKWVTDITYLPYGSTMMYLSTIINLYNNEIVKTLASFSHTRSLA
ncbi:transposase InsO family protein, partial [Neobacillus niacini]|nr:transposase InsO family protein [Neobacillus niacini]